MTNNFNFSDVLALMGLAQSLYLLVYILFRAGSIRNIFVPSFCMLIFVLSFTTDFALPRFNQWEHAEIIRSFFWMVIPASSALLINQVADFGRLPSRFAWATLLLPVLAAVIGYGVFKSYDVFVTLGIISGCLCFLSLWAERRTFSDLKDDKLTRNERYWLIVSFLIMNIFILVANFFNLSGSIDNFEFILVRDVLGIGMVYLASTSLLRIYPQSVRLVERSKIERSISLADQEIVLKIKNLLELDKIYQEANFSRADLARELDVSEANVSRLISGFFGKSLPQLINELRIRDSLQLLKQTDAAISVVAEQVGFSSLPTFNRVFKDIMNISPSEYRLKEKKSISNLSTNQKT